MTGLSRWAIAGIGLGMGIVAITVAEILLGVASLCGLHENQIATGYCAAGEAAQAVIEGVPIATVILGYAITLRTARLTPIAVAAFCAVAEGLVGMAGGI